jgi:hypothetical protein
MSWTTGLGEFNKQTTLPGGEMLGRLEARRIAVDGEMICGFSTSLTHF